MTTSFKDVGVLKEIGSTFLERNRSLRPIGVKTPLERDLSTNSLFVMHTDIRAQIADNFRNLVQTNWGDRVAIIDFGANLIPLVTEYTNKEDFENQAVLRINTAVNRWMPFIEPLSLDSTVDLQDNEVVGKIKLLIVYAIPALNVQNDSLEVTLSII